MTRLPPTYPHQVVSDWIAANDAHVLADSAERRLMDITWGDYSSLPDYDVSTRRARKMQAEAIAGISEAIGRIVSNAISSLGGHWRNRRQIERLSRLSPRLLDDAGIPHEIQARIRARHTHSQPHRLSLYL
jgi:uncharacterized protein YjiS (DUF1127 family)